MPLATQCDMLQSNTSVSSKGKRTNSLAFCKTDCHTCASLGQHCDRRRPQCTTCLLQGRKCGGFVTPLSWDKRRILTDRPFSMAGDASRNDPGASKPQDGATADVSTKGTTCPSRSDPPRTFRFVMGASKPRKRRKTTSRTGEDAPTKQGQSGGDSLLSEEAPLTAANEYNNNNAGLLNCGLVENYLGEFETLGEAFDCDPNLIDYTIRNFFDPMPLLDHETQPLSPTTSDSIPVPQTLPLTAVEGSGDTNESDLRLESAKLAHGHDAILRDTTNIESSGTQNDQCICEVTVPSGLSPLDSPRTVLHVSGRDHTELLQMYDTELCVLPLTSDMSMNPFRCQQKTSWGSRLLFHSILALCCQHLERLTGSWSTEAVEHRRKASEILESALQNAQTTRGFQLLQPILIMFTLDCTLSAAGNWTAHLKRAHSILQDCGGPEALKAPHIRCQVAMLQWWDATLALLSRTGPIIDQAYVDFLARWEEQDDWSFFDLTGCPRELVAYLYHLAELAKAHQVAMSMKWLHFNMEPVLETEQKLIHWKNEYTVPEDQERYGLTDADAEKRFHETQDRYHCVEAWRHALLIYIARVFKYDGKHGRPNSMNRLVRTTIDHIRCCRRSSQIQKQLLLPAFLAGCETSDEDLRTVVKEYCHYWGNKSRYNMFHTVPRLLDDVWTTGRWWGAVIDSKTSSEYGRRGSQFLLG